MKSSATIQHDSDNWFEKEDGQSKVSADTPNFNREEARYVFTSFSAESTSMEDQAAAIQSYLSRKYGVGMKVSLN